MSDYQQEIHFGANGERSGLATERVHIYPNVANRPLRPPVMLAKAAASLDVLSGGRIELGLGTGIEAMGGAGRSRSKLVEAMEVVVQLIRAYWKARSPCASMGGTMSSKVHAWSIGLWLSSYGPRKCLLRVGTLHYRIDELMRLAVEFGIDTFIYWPQTTDCGRSSASPQRRNQITSLLTCGKRAHRGRDEHVCRRGECLPCGE